MARLYQRGPVFWIAYKAHGRLKRLSTGLRDRAEAEATLATYEAMEKGQQAGRLNDDFYRALSGRELPNKNLAEAVREWLEECRRVTVPGTVSRYSYVLNPFLRFLKADLRVSDVTTAHITAFLNGKTLLSKASVNYLRRVLSIFFRRCQIHNWCIANPVVGTKGIRIRREDRVRRAYTLDELRLVFRQAQAKPFWNFLVHGGYYAGLRLGDLILARKSSFVWGDKPKMTLYTKKTDTPVEPPLHPAFAPIARTAWENAPKLGNPQGYLWPKEAAQYLKSGNAPFSKQFKDHILRPIGLAPAKLPWKKIRKLKDAGEIPKEQPRVRNPLTFHCLRHSFCDSLEKAGVARTVRKELAGHSTDQAHDAYLHCSPEQLQQAVDSLPSIL